jgi:hypothetical protein
MSVYCPPVVHQSLCWTFPPGPVARIFQESDGAGVKIRYWKSHSSTKFLVSIVKIQPRSQYLLVLGFQRGLKLTLIPHFWLWVYHPPICPSFYCIMCSDKWSIEKGGLLGRDNKFSLLYHLQCAYSFSKCTKNIFKMQAA